MLLLLAPSIGLAFTRYMKKSSESETPYQALGTHLKEIRERKNETLAEVSGAVEIDSEALAKIEQGHERPSEDILMLLINHFDMQDQEAVHLWESAGYDSEESRQQNIFARMPLPPEADKATIVVLALDARTMYTDEATVTANEAGVAIMFTDNTDGKSMPVAKVGMSYDQAERLVQILTNSILYGKHQSAQKRLPPKKHYK